MRTVVTALQNVRLEVVVAMVVHRCVDGSLVEPRRHHSAHICLVGDAWELRDSSPRRASIARDRHYAVIGADVKQSLLHRRLVDCADVSVLGGPLMTCNRVTRPDFPHYRQTVAIQLTCEIRAETRPCISAAGALEEIVRAKVKRVVIVRRNEHRRAPIPPVWSRTESGEWLDGFLLPC